MKTLCGLIISYWAKINGVKYLVHMVDIDTKVESRFIYMENHMSKYIQQFKA